MTPEKITGLEYKIIELANALGYYRQHVIASEISVDCRCVIEELFIACYRVAFLFALLTRFSVLNILGRLKHSWSFSIAQPTSLVIPCFRSHFNTSLQLLHQME